MSHPPFLQNVVVITGASLGIGRELALQLADQGAWLALAARNLTELETVAADCERRGGRALVVPTDVMDEAQCRNLIEQTVGAYGRIDTLVNNAGVSMTARFEDVADLSHYERIMKTNYLGMVYCTKYALPYLKVTQGRLVGLSSLSGRTGVPLYTAYASSKHAIIGFLESLRIEVEPDGITVTIILPDFIASGLHERNVDAQGNLLGKSHHMQYSRLMSTEKCVQIMIRAMAARKRDRMISHRGLIVDVGQWVKLIAPRMVDGIARRAMERGR